MADKKFTDLVANPDTNLAVAAVGDYLLIYDISEPLDINKIKVISIANLTKAVDVPIIMARQGGSSTNWSVEGTTNYDITVPPIAQSGKRMLTIADGQSYGVITITFPHPFKTGETPFILPTFTQLTSSADPKGPRMVLEDLTNSYLQIAIKLDSALSGSPRYFFVSWLAIGNAA